MQDGREHSIIKFGIRLSAEQESCVKRFQTRYGQRRPRRDNWEREPTILVLNWQRTTMRSDSGMNMKNQCNKSRHPDLDESARLRMRRPYDVQTQRQRRLSSVLGYFRDEGQRIVRQQHLCKSWRSQWISDRNILCCGTDSSRRRCPR